MLRIILFILSITVCSVNLAAECVSGDCEGGTGVMIMEGGARYEGQFQGGKPHGKGEYQDINGNNYKGDFKDGHLDGKVTFKYATGPSDEYGEHASFEGKVKYIPSKNVSVYTGTGVILYKNGSIYSGGFKDDRFNGIGTFVNNLDKTIFVGKWKAGKKDGKGNLYKMDKLIEKGKWKQDVKI